MLLFEEVQFETEEFESIVAMIPPEYEVKFCEMEVILFPDAVLLEMDDSVSANEDIPPARANIPVEMMLLLKALLCEICA